MQIKLIFFQIPQDEIKVCEDCSASLENIFKMMLKSRAVDNMLMELQERLKTESMTNENITEIRREFGFDCDEDSIESYLTEVLYEEDPKEETIEYEQKPDEELLYEDIDEDVESLSAVEEVEYEQEENEQHIIAEQLAQETEIFNNNKRSPDEDMYEYKCHICNELFDRMCFLSNHTRTMHQCMPKVACCGCGRYLSTWDSLMAHKRKHSPEESNYKCDFCSTAFRTKTGLSIHIKFKHEKPAKTFTCNTCGKTFKEQSVLKGHMRVHLPDAEKFAFECEICGKKMVNRFSLKYHISTIHEKEKNHFCHLCGRGFGNKSNLRSHLISHSTENVSCDVCGGIFKNRVSLQSHKKIHKPKHLRKFSCKTCNKTFHSQHHLSRHSIAHSDERRFKCPFPNCLNEYKWQKDLNNHLAAVHTGELR